MNVGVCICVLFLSDGDFPVHLRATSKSRLAGLMEPIARECKLSLDATAPCSFDLLDDIHFDLTGDDVKIPSLKDSES